MCAAQPARVETVVRTVANAFNTGTVFETREDVDAVCAAVARGLLRLVPIEHDPFRMYDGVSGAQWGVELTVAGMRHVGIDENEYYKK